MMRERLLAIFEWPGGHWRFVLGVALGSALEAMLLIYAPLIGEAALMGAVVGLLIATVVSLWS